MTKVFDDNARINLLSQFDFKETQYNDSPVFSMSVIPISIKLAREYIATYHYTKTMPDSTKYAFGGFYEDKLAGVIVYGMGSSKNQYLSLFPNLENGQYLELTRLWERHPMGDIIKTVEISDANVYNRL